jgi:hypothetical protein
LCALQELDLIVPEAELFRPEADGAVVNLIGDYESYIYFLLIDQKRVHIEVLSRADGWQSVVLDRLDAILKLPEFGFSTRVANLYRGTPLLRP